MSRTPIFRYFRRSNRFRASSHQTGRSHLCLLWWGHTVYLAERSCSRHVRVHWRGLCSWVDVWRSSRNAGPGLGIRDHYYYTLEQGLANRDRPHCHIDSFQQSRAKPPLIRDVSTRLSAKQFQAQIVQARETMTHYRGDGRCIHPQILGHRKMAEGSERMAKRAAR